MREQIYSVIGESKIRKSSFIARRKWKANKENLEIFSKAIEKTSLCKPKSINNVSTYLMIFNKG